jgi:hypothetical protein
MSSSQTAIAGRVAFVNMGLMFHALLYQNCLPSFMYRAVRAAAVSFVCLFPIYLNDVGSILAGGGPILATVVVTFLTCARKKGHGKRSRVRSVPAISTRVKTSCSGAAGLHIAAGRCCYSVGYVLDCTQQQ